MREDGGIGLGEGELRRRLRVQLLAAEAVDSTPGTPTTSSWNFPLETREGQLDEMGSFVAKKQKNCNSLIQGLAAMAARLSDTDLVPYPTRFDQKKKNMFMQSYVNSAGISAFPTSIDQIELLT